MKTLLAILFFLIAGYRSQPLTGPEGHHIGDYVNDFKLKSISGKMISMADFKDAKGFIIVFTCNTCPFSVLYENRIIDLYNTYSPEGYPVLAINSNDPTFQPGDSFENMQTRGRDKKYPFPYLSDDTQEVARNFGATATPNVFILKKTNQGLQLVYMGAIDNNPKDPSKASKHYVQKAMQEIMNGQPVSEPVTDVIGCGIRWKTE